MFVGSWMKQSNINYQMQRLKKKMVFIYMISELLITAFKGVIAVLWEFLPEMVITIKLNYCI